MWITPKLLQAQLVLQFEDPALREKWQKSWILIKFPKRFSIYLITV